MVACEQCIYIGTFNSTSTTAKVYFYNADNKILFIYGCVSWKFILWIISCMIYCHDMYELTLVIAQFYCINLHILKIYNLESLGFINIIRLIYKCIIASIYFISLHQIYSCSYINKLVQQPLPISSFKTWQWNKIYIVLYNIDQKYHHHMF